MWEIFLSKLKYLIKILIFIEIFVLKENGGEIHQQNEIKIRVTFYKLKNYGYEKR